MRLTFLTAPERACSDRDPLSRCDSSTRPLERRVSPVRAVARLAATSEDIPCRPPRHKTSKRQRGVGATPAAPVIGIRLRPCVAAPLLGVRCHRAGPKGYPVRVCGAPRNGRVSTTIEQPLIVRGPRRAHTGAATGGSTARKGFGAHAAAGGLRHSDPSISPLCPGEYPQCGTTLGADCPASSGDPVRLTPTRSPCNARNM